MLPKLPPPTMRMPKIIEVFNRHHSLRWFAVATIVATVLGSLLDSVGFWVNVLAGFVSALIGIGVSILIIEKLLSDQNAQVWEQTRQSLIESIVVQLNAAIREYLELISTIGKYRDLLESQSEVSENRVYLMRQLHTELSYKSADDLRESCIDIFQSLRGILSKVSALGLLYTMTTGSDNGFVVQLAQIDSVFSTWERMMARNASSQLVSSSLVERSLATLSAITNSLEYFISAKDFRQ